MARNGTKQRGPGYDGAELVRTGVRLSANRAEKRVIRCRPGSFEWRYGRKAADAALYHAGNHFADLWERAGISAPAVSLDAVGGGTGWKGLPDGRAVAMNELRRAMFVLGTEPASRLISYCVQGLTVAHLASGDGVSERSMRAVLHSDLEACARYFRFL